MKKHGAEKRKTWRKLHLAIDMNTHEVISAEISLVNVGCYQRYSTNYTEKSLPYLPMTPKAVVNSCQRDSEKEKLNSIDSTSIECSTLGSWLFQKLSRNSSENRTIAE